MTWHKIKLSQIQVVNGLEIQIQNEFETLFSSLGYMKGFALFHGKIDGNGGIIYISPIASEHSNLLILKYGGQPCAAPEKESAFFWLGNDEDKDSLSDANS